jgi:hypothetical protein
MVDRRYPICYGIPLPSLAQFLNVIQCVFSGLAKAVLHNIDYASPESCKDSIDVYFTERNRYYIQHPHKAGNKIWGKELVIPSFDETKNCKDPKWR